MQISFWRRKKRGKKNLTGINIHRTRCFLLAWSFIHFNVCDFFPQSNFHFFTIIYLRFSRFIFWCCCWIYISPHKHTYTVTEGSNILLHIVAMSLLVWYSSVTHQTFLCVVVDLHNNFHLSSRQQRYTFSNTHTHNIVYEIGWKIIFTLVFENEINFHACSIE